MVSTRRSQGAPSQFPSSHAADHSVQSSTIFTHSTISSTRTHIRPSVKNQGYEEQSSQDSLEDEVANEEQDDTQPSASATYSRVYPELLDAHSQELEVNETNAEYQSDESYLDVRANAHSTPIMGSPFSPLQPTLRSRRVYKLFDQRSLDGESPIISGNILGNIIRKTMDSFRESAPRPRSFSRTRRGSSSSLENGIFVKALLFILLCLAVYFIYAVYMAEVKLNPVQQYDEFIARARHLITEKYGYLNKDDRHTLAMIGRKWLLDREAPPVSIVVTGRNARAFAHDFGRMTHELVAAHSPFSAIEASSNSQRALLHDHLLAIMGQKTSSEEEVQPSVATILEANKLEWDALLVLHAFADGETAPIKNSMLVISVDTQIDATGVSCENALYDYLLKQWMKSALSEDRIAPILSRILQYTICLPQ